MLLQDLLIEEIFGENYGSWEKLTINYVSIEVF